MNDQSVYDIAVIGAGIAGASVAYRLASERRVLLLERESQPGYHTTGRSAAMFIESYGPSAVRALTRASREFFLSPPSGFATQPLLLPRSALYVAKSDQQAMLAQQFEQLRATCPELDRLDQNEAVAMVPCLRPETVAGAMLDRGAMDINVDALHQGFLRGLRAQGGSVRTHSEVVSALRRGTFWELGLGGGDEVRVGAVINAAGAWADKVGHLFGARHIGLVPHRRTAFTFQPPAGISVADWPVVAGLDETYYFKPDAGVLLGSPANADPMPPHDVVAEEIDVATAIHHIEAATTLTIRRPLRTWAGLRSFVPDGEMVIGWDAQCEGFFWLAGQGGYGIQSAPGVSEFAASLVLGAPMPQALLAQGLDSSAVSPRRLP
ncbi:MAG: FAD-binding oxidoreductase [Rhodoferax sp.]|nr:FAD-binding oxidoreductase [Rhodoferax sp.]